MGTKLQSHCGSGHRVSGRNHSITREHKRAGCDLPMPTLNPTLKLFDKPTSSLPGSKLDGHVHGHMPGQSRMPGHLSAHMLQPSHQIRSQVGHVDRYSSRHSIGGCCDSDASVAGDGPQHKVPITIEGVDRQGMLVRDDFRVGHGETIDLSHIRYTCSGGKQAPFKDVTRLLWDPEQLSWQFNYICDVSNQSAEVDSTQWNQRGNQRCPGGNQRCAAVFEFADVLPGGLVPATNQGPENPRRQPRRPVFEHCTLTFHLE